MTESLRDVVYPHWTELMPHLAPIVEERHLPQSLGLAAAEDVVEGVATHGFRPEDVAFVRHLVERHDEDWSTPGLIRLADFLSDLRFGAPIRTVWRENSRNKPAGVGVPAFVDLIRGRIAHDRFGAILRDVREMWYEGDIDRMAEDARLSARSLVLFMEGLRIPGSHADVVRLAHGLRMDADALSYAWMSARTNGFSGILGMQTCELQWFAGARILAVSSGLRLERPAPALDRGHVLRSTAGLAFAALRAGFDEAGVIAVAADYATSFPRAFANLVSQAEGMSQRGHHGRAAMLYRIAAYHYEELGEFHRAALMAAQGGHALGRITTFQDEKAARQIRQQRVHLYEQALRLYEQDDSQVAKIATPEFARHVAVLRERLRSEDEPGAPAAAPLPEEGVRPDILTDAFGLEYASDMAEAASAEAAASSVTTSGIMMIGTSVGTVRMPVGR